MKKNGFTLVELLAVIVLIAIITVIGGFSITGAQKQINKDLWNTQESLIISRAKTFGEDNKQYIENMSCNDYKGSLKSKCLKISVQNLIDRKYLSTKDKDGCDNKVLVNDTVTKDKASCYNENICYYVNNWPIYIYLENNNVYAELITPNECL